MASSWGEVKIGGTIKLAISFSLILSAKLEKYQRWEWGSKFKLVNKLLLLFNLDKDQKVDFIT